MKRTMVAAAALAASTLAAAPALAQQSDLSISVSNYNAYASTAPQRYDWDWHWGPNPVQAAALAVGGQEYFEIGVANGAAAAPIAGPATIVVKSDLPKGVSYFAANAPWQCSAAPGASGQTATCSYALGAGEALDPGKALKKLYLSTTIGADLAEYGSTCASVSGVSDANAANNSACSGGWRRYFAGRPALWGEIDRGGESVDYVNGQTGRSFLVRVANDVGDPLRKGMRIVMTTGALHAAFTNLKGPESANPAEWNCVTTGQVVRCEKTLAADVMHGVGLGQFKIMTDVVATGYASPTLSATFEAFDLNGVPVLMQRGAKITSTGSVTVKMNP